MNWPADKIERRALSSLVPYARNSRTHSEAQIAQLIASMREWGWTNPVLIDEDSSIIAGHARVMAAERLGFAEVPVMIAAGWSEAQKRAYVLADNKLALNAGWDDQVLIGELIAIDGLMDLVGFSADELRALSIGVPEVEFKDLPKGEKGEFCTITFTLHNDQAAMIDRAIAAAKAGGPFAGPNTNSNGNAIARICEAYLG